MGSSFRLRRENWRRLSLKKDTFYAPENLQTNLFEIYDEENVIDIQRKVLPRIQKKIEACLNQDNTIKKMKDRLNQKQWLLQPMQNRGKALEQIIGNGFDAQSLKKEEQEVLFHFEQTSFVWRKVFKGITLLYTWSLQEIREQQRLL